MLTAEDACADISVARTPAVGAGRMGNLAAIEGAAPRKKQAQRASLPRAALRRRIRGSKGRPQREVRSRAAHIR